MGAEWQGRSRGSQDRRLLSSPSAASAIRKSLLLPSAPDTPRLLTTQASKGEGPTRSPGVLLNHSGFPGAPRKGPGRRVGQAGKVGKNPTQSGPGVPSSTYLRHQSIFGIGSGFPRKIWGEHQPVAPFRWNLLGAWVPGPGQLEGQGRRPLAPPGWSLGEECTAGWVPCSGTLGPAPPALP